MTTVLATTDKTLTKPEASRLVKLEETIRSGMRTFFEVGEALQEIRSGSLYRESFGSFEEYCRDKWDFGKSHVYRLIEACEIRKNLSPIGDVLPTTESQIRPLSQLSEDKQCAAWAAVLKRAPEVDGEKHITAKLVSTVVNEMKKPARAATTTEEDDPAPEKLSLAVALQELNDAVIGLREQWPEDELKTLVVKLRRLADEIEEELAE